MSYLHELGRKGEESAALVLHTNCMNILHQNWRKGRFEIDIICQDKENLVFVEVKTRKQGSLTSPEESIVLKKRQHMISAAQSYLTIHNLWNNSCRFDAICIVVKKNTFILEHYRNIFELPESMDSRYTYWQPW